MINEDCFGEHIEAAKLAKVLIPDSFLTRLHRETLMHLPSSSLVPRHIFRIYGQLICQGMCVFKDPCYLRKLWTNLDKIVWRAGMCD